MMKLTGLIDEQKLFICKNCEKVRNLTLEIVDIPKGGLVDKTLHNIEMVFVLNGKFILSSDKIRSQEINPGSIVLYSPGSRIRVTVTEDSKLVICRIHEFLQFCECVLLESMYTSRQNTVKEIFYALPIHERIYQFIE